MIPILYSAAEEDFTSLGIGTLADAISCRVRTKLNGSIELEMKYPVTGRRYKDLQLLRIIKAVPEKGGNPQLFDIQKITKPLKGVVTVNASHVSDRKRFIPILPFSASTLAETLTSLRLFSAEYNPFTFWTDKEVVANFKLSTPASLGMVLGGMAGSVVDTYAGEYEFDNFTVKLWNHRGQDNGVTLRYGKNITSIEQEESIAATVTGICPFWSDTEGNTIILPENTIDGENVQNFPFKRTLTVDFTADFESAPTQEQLRSRAQSYVVSNAVGIPEVGIDLSFEHLSEFPEYAEMGGIEDVKLGDTVHVYFDPLDITASARITQTDYNVLEDKYNSVRVGSVKASLSYTILGMKDMAVDESKTRMGAIYAQLNEMPGQITAEVNGMIDQTLQDALSDGGSISGAIDSATSEFIRTSDIIPALNDINTRLVDADTINLWISQAVSSLSAELAQYIVYSPDTGLMIKAIGQDGQQSQTYLRLLNDLLAFMYGDTMPAWMTHDTFNINNLMVQKSASLVGLIIQEVIIGNISHLRIS